MNKIVEVQSLAIVNRRTNNSCANIAGNVHNLCVGRQPKVLECFRLKHLCQEEFTCKSIIFVIYEHDKKKKLKKKH